MRSCFVCIMERRLFKNKAEETVNCLNRPRPSREKQGSRISRTSRISAGRITRRSLRVEHKPEMPRKTTEDRKVIDQREIQEKFVTALKLY